MATNNQIILGQLVEEAKTRLGIPKDDLAFLHLTAEEVLFEHDVDLDEIEKGVVDGSGDGSIDASFLFVNGSLIQEEEQELPKRSPVEIDWVIVTSQHRDGFAETVLTRMRNTFRDLLRVGEDIDFTGVTYSPRIIELFRLFGSVVFRLAATNPKIRIVIAFSCRGSSANIHQRVHAEKSNLIGEIKQSLAIAEADVMFLGAEDLIALNRRVRTRTKALRCFEVISSENGDGYVALVRLDDFYQFLQNDAGQLQAYLFDANVRDFQGDNQVNLAIRATLDDATAAPEFWWFNNGATIVAAKATPQGKVITLDDPLIVNGLQTSSVIYKYKASGAGADNRAILIKIIVPTSDEIRDQIIRATNQQTNIPPAFLRAMDKVHRDIEAYMVGRGIYYERRKNLYRNQGKPRGKIITIGELSQACVATLLLRPSVARARPNSIIQQDDQYQAIFSEKIGLEIYAGVIELLKRMENTLNGYKSELDTRDRNNIRYHCLSYLVAVHTGDVGPYTRLITRKFTDEELEDALLNVFSIYEDLGASDKVAKSIEFQTAVLGVAKKNYQPAADPASVKKE